MAYVKLDCGILRSTLWIDREAREVFITALLMAEPRALEVPAPQLELVSLNTTGWLVPPGPYGFVEAAGAAIIHQARVDREAGLAALERLGSPEPDSRSQAHDGRRLVRVDGGFVVLNFDFYRDKDHTAAERMARYRAKKKALVDNRGQRGTTGDSNGRHAVTSRSNGVTGRNVTQAEAEAEAEELRFSSVRSLRPSDSLPGNPDDLTKSPRAERNRQELHSLAAGALGRIPT